MAIKSKLEVARFLRSEAHSLLRHGFTNFFSHSFACVLAQVLRPDACEGCLLVDYVAEEYGREAFPCQHIDQAHWEKIAVIAGLPERVAARWLKIAAELEVSAEAEESLVVAASSRQ